MKKLSVDHQLNVSYALGPAWLGMPDEIPLKGYFQSQVGVGYTPILWRHGTYFEGGPTVELTYNHLSGNETVQGSNSDSFGLRVGVDQRFLTHGFIRAVVGIHANINRLDLGFGHPLEEETALGFNAALALGGQYCFGKRDFCMGVVVEGYYTRILAGGTEHHGAGVLLGPAFTFGAKGAPKTEAAREPALSQKTEHEVRVHVTTDAQVERLERQVEGLEKKVSGLEALNRDLTGQKASLTEELVRARRAHQFEPYRRVIIFNEGSSTLPVEARYNPPGQKGDQDPSICKVNCSPELELIINYINDNLPQIEKIVVHGHTSQTGQAEQDNKVLSDARSKVVSDYLKVRGIPAAMIEAISHGSRQPTTAGQSGEWDQRAEIEIIWKKGEQQ